VPETLAPSPSGSVHPACALLHLLPPYCRDDNRIERVWLDLHANVTRNHRCKSMRELMAHVAALMRANNRREKDRGR